MSAELIAIIAMTLTSLTATLGGLAWVVSRVDRVESRLGARLDRVESRLGTRIDGVEASMGTRIDGVERELTEVKIALARIEGPRPHFVTR